MLSAVFSSLTAVFSKLSLKRIKSHTAVFIRTCIILIFLWVIVIVTGALDYFTSITPNNVIFLVLSGLCTGFSWICYYKALSLGEVVRVSAVDKSSVTLTVIIGISFLGESITAFKIIGVIFILIGTYCMLNKNSNTLHKNKISWLPFAILSAIFAALTSIFAKVGLQGLNSDLATAIRTGVVFVMAGAVAFVIDFLIPMVKSSHISSPQNNHTTTNLQTSNYNDISRYSKSLTQTNAPCLQTSETTSAISIGKRRSAIKEAIFLILSALATTFAWLMYYRALSLGDVSVVAPIDKLSIALTIILSWLFLKEKLNKKSVFGIIFLTVGSVIVIF
jgi:transporter family protein